jgi:hypothetical protein
MTIELSGGLSINQKQFRIDNRIYDEVFINIKFFDDNVLSKNDKIKIGNNVCRDIVEILKKKGYKK